VIVIVAMTHETNRPAGRKKRVREETEDREREREEQLLFNWPFRVFSFSALSSGSKA